MEEVMTGAPVIGEAQIAEAIQILLDYKTGKAVLEQKIIENERWYRGRHWEMMKDGKGSEVQPSSGWLFNSIANKHADCMDNFPSVNVLPREAGDAEEAKKLSSILPVVFDQTDFEQTYSDVSDAKLKTGTGVYGVFWDKSRHNGLGDISITKVDMLNLFWEPGITDIQKSRNVFCVENVSNDLLQDLYPELRGKSLGSALKLSEYVQDDDTKPSDKSAVVDWYYKKQVGGKTVLHYVKFVGNHVLYATENDTTAPMETRVDPATGKTLEVPIGDPPSVRGLYDHGRYPFIPDVMFRVEGSVAGFGYIDIGKSAQEYIDRANQAIMENMLANASGRYFVREGTDIKPEDLLDFTKKVVPVGQNFTRDSVQPVTDTPLDSIYLTALNHKVDELKEVTGNRDISTGGTTSGVTAASAIAAMQEAGSKLSRDANKAAYRAFKKVALMVIELIRQFYDLPRQFRILGGQGAEQFVSYSNAGIVPQLQSADYGQTPGYRLPVFDVEVTAQKASPYSKMSQNEMALQFYNAGFFNPQLADQALLCLEMMDFDRKDMLIQKIAKNSQILQFMQMLAATAAPPMPSGHPTADGQEALGDDRIGESTVTENARKRVAESTAPV